ncbi:hypothetical protein G5I_02578 [Acromyrmex echinatior]|uniref:Uncharacterized protein n=1 Tax=Acromyrmex echinatior TaxID=103372 RepID=F4WAP0_ACREC|nr:hypothetical protein G5I_02578 [Acromyrmex echinatior]
MEELQGIEYREEKKVGRRSEETEEVKRRIRWRRLECPRTTNGADTTGLPFTVYLPVVRISLTNGPADPKGLNASHPPVMSAQFVEPSRDERRTMALTSRRDRKAYFAAFALQGRTTQQPKFVHHVRVTGVRADRYESTVPRKDESLDKSFNEDLLLQDGTLAFIGIFSTTRNTFSEKPRTP